MSAPLPFSLSDGYLIQEDFLWDGNAVTTLNLGTTVTVRYTGWTRTLLFSVLRAVRSV